MKVTYRDLENEAPRISFCGVTFLDGVPVEIDPDAEGADHLLRKAAHNPFFTVGGAEPDEQVVQAVRKRGRKAGGSAPVDHEEPKASDDGYVDAT